MGVYDIFGINCPGCGVEDNPQTKLFACELKFYKVGDELGSFPGVFYHPDDYVLELKNKCYNCKKPLFLIVEKGIIKKVVNEADPTVTEQNFGSYVLRGKKK